MIRSTYKRRPRRVLSIILPLVLINVGVLGLLSRQILIVHAQNKQVLAAGAALPELAPVAAPSDPLLATDDKPLITTYTVVAGDTLSQIAEKFDISTNTVRWANDLTGTSRIKPGDKLIILPVSGMLYKVVRGDTLSQIAERFHAKQSDILEFNDIDSADKIKPGVELIIPEGVPIAAPKPVKQPKPTPTSTTTSSIAANSPTTTSPDMATPTAAHDIDDYFITPMPGSVLSQGLHDGTAVDMAGPSGTNIRAAAAGRVVAVKDNNTWNGGYGYYLVIQHNNGTQTLYAHLSRIDVEVGDDVEQGEHIALSGRTGRVTGPHLHFEVRGGVNPFASDKRGTQY